MEPILDDRPVLAGCQSLVPNLGLVRDFDGDGTPDVIVPSKDGLAFYRSIAGHLAKTPVDRIVMPGDERWSGASAGRSYPLARVEDLNGDRIPDLLVRKRAPGSNEKPDLEILRGMGEGRFRAPLRIAFGAILTAGPPPAGSKTDQDVTPELDYFGDLDGDGLAEAVVKVSLDGGKSGMKQAKEPHYLYRFYRADKNLVLAPKPYQELKVAGHGFEAEFGDVRMKEFQDLDGDGRKDLITVTLSFSVFQIIRVLATKRIGIGLDFHVWHQAVDGSFSPVEGLDLSETVRFDLNDLKLERLAQFAGDFDGDGRTDFVHLGRGKEVTIHRGQPGCHYPAKPDLTIQLEEEPQDIGLVRVGDFDGDGRADIAVTRPLQTDDPGASAPVRLDLYLSGSPQ
jgi:hypothetical protein